MFFAFKSFATASEGWAPFPSQSFTLSSSNSINDGSCCGLYRPTISMNLPSRGERESATTTRYTGFFFDPTRVNLMRTAKPLPPGFLSFLAFVGFCRLSLSRLLSCRRGRAAGKGSEIRHLALAHAFHQLLHLLACLDQPVDVLDRGAGSARDPLAPRAVDHSRRATFLRRQREDDRLNPAELLLVDLVQSLEPLAEPGDHLEDAL